MALRKLDWTQTRLALRQLDATELYLPCVAIALGLHTTTSTHTLTAIAKVSASKLIHMADLQFFWR